LPYPASNKCTHNKCTHTHYTNFTVSYCVPILTNARIGHGTMMGLGESLGVAVSVVADLAAADGGVSG